MIVDARTIPSGTTVRADLCIVGAGPAGIAIAREFADHSSRVVLLESGDTTVREKTQSLGRGNIAGLAYPPLHVCRRRVLGGSSSYWGGWSRPLDEIDFEERPWLAYSGWPFTRDHLKAEYVRAHSFWKLGNSSDENEPTESESGACLLKPESNDFQNILFRVKGTRFGKIYRGELERARNLELMLHASAIEIETDRDHGVALSVRVATLAENRFAVSARSFVLAAGGLENPRILLCSRGSRPSGIGNDNDLVGRFFADHLHLQLRKVHLDGRQVPDFYRARKAQDTTFRGGMALTEDARRRDELLGFAFTIHNPDDPHDVVWPAYTSSGYASLQALAKPLTEGEIPDLVGHHVRTVLRHPVNAATMAFRRLVPAKWRALVVGCRAEQSPNRDSRVLLDDERDIFGMNKVRLNWRLTDQDLDSLRRAQQLLDNEWNFPSKDTRRPPSAKEPDAEIRPASHHMGTTRMHRDPKLGVVDENCRVHGIRNLYVAGSSVFPTTGWAPPTLTIVALALRLADHLKRSQP